MSYVLPLAVLISFCGRVESETRSSYDDESLARHILEATDWSTRVYLPGSNGYEAKRRVKNGLCAEIRPALIAAPKTTRDVSVLVRLAKTYKKEISIRSGGHSYTCTSLKQGKKGGAPLSRGSCI